MTPDAYFDAPNQDQEAPTQAKANASRGLDQPHSFRNDQPHSFRNDLRLLGYVERCWDNHQDVLIFG